MCSPRRDLSAPDPRAGWADAGAPDLVARGRIVYQQSCAACHGARLEGQPNWRQPNADGTLPAPPHDVTGHTWHHSDQMLFDITKYGSASVAGAGFKSAMPVYDGVWTTRHLAVLAFIKSHWPPDIHGRVRGRTTRADAPTRSVPLTACR